MLNKILISIAIGLVITSSCMALDENNYDEQYKENIVPLIQKMGEGFFDGSEKVRIHYRTFLQAGARNCVVILPGRTEPVEKYAEVIYDLTRTAAGKKLNFYLMDHRGQGSSGRMKAPTDLGYVDLFQNYVNDVGLFVNNQGLESICEKRFLLAHSMGAGIATAFVIQHPDYFNKVALSSPMLKIMTKPYSYAVARVIVETSTLAGRGAKFAIGQKGFEPDSKFEENTFTSSPIRFKMAMSMFDTFPVAKLGGVANRWVLEIMKGTNPLHSHYHEISVPLRVFHAGLEAYSEPSEMIKLCDEAADCKRTILPTSKHEVMMDRDVNRDIVMNELSNFFK
ncbi:MAG: alpha/beta hydrolase [Bacteriovorax sp.]|nr:alpha/beta hydrolase [Bacteriovorax sp.]